MSQSSDYPPGVNPQDVEWGDDDYAEIAQRDFERAIYKRCDEDDRELCEECDHPLECHADHYGCEYDMGDRQVQDVGAVAIGPCHCKAHKELHDKETCGECAVLRRWELARKIWQDNQRAMDIADNLMGGALSEEKK